MLMLPGQLLKLCSFDHAARVGSFDAGLPALLREGRLDTLHLLNPARTLKSSRKDPQVRR